MLYTFEKHFESNVPIKVDGTLKGVQRLVLPTSSKKKKKDDA